MKSMKKIVSVALFLLLIAAVLSLGGCEVGYFIPMLTGSEPPDTTLAVPTETADTEPDDDDGNDEPDGTEPDNTEPEDGDDESGGVPSDGDDTETAPASDTESGTGTGIEIGTGSVTGGDATSPDTSPGSEQATATLPVVTA